MAWTDPKTWTAEVMSSSDLNTHVRDNLNALKDPPSDFYTFNDSADWSSSSTSWANIDGTDLFLSIDTNGGDVIVHFHGTTNNLTQVYFDIAVDGTRYFGDDGIIRVANGTILPASFTVIVSGLAAGTHTFAMQWRAASATTISLYAGAGTANNDLHGQFWAREIS